MKALRLSTIAAHTRGALGWLLLIGSTVWVPYGSRQGHWKILNRFACCVVVASSTHFSGSPPPLGSSRLWVKSLPEQIVSGYKTCVCWPIRAMRSALIIPEADGSAGAVDLYHEPGTSRRRRAAGRQRALTQWFQMIEFVCRCCYVTSCCSGSMRRQAAPSMARQAARVGLS